MWGRKCLHWRHWTWSYLSKSISLSPKVILQEKITWLGQEPGAHCCVLCLSIPGRETNPWSSVGLPPWNRVGIGGGKGELGIFHILVLNLNQWFSQPREGVCLFSYGIGVASSCAKYLWGREETTWSFWKPEKNFGGWKRNKINFLFNFESAESVLLFMPSRESRIIGELRKKAFNQWICYCLRKPFISDWSGLLGIFCLLEKAAVRGFVPPAASSLWW